MIPAIRAITGQAAEKASLSEAGIRLESGWNQACHFFRLWKGFGTIRVPGPLVLHHFLTELGVRARPRR